MTSSETRKALTTISNPTLRYVVDITHVAAYNLKDVH